MYVLNTLTDEKVKCQILQVEVKDFKQIRIAFSFDWWKARNVGKIYKLVTEHNNFIHGMMAIADKEDHLSLALIESSPVNIGRNKLYLRVAGNLIAFAANLALEEFEGYMVMIAKTELIEYYCGQYGFVQLGSTSRLISYPFNSKKLVNLYYEAS